MAGTNRRAPARGKRTAPRGTASSSPSSATKRRFFDYPRSGYQGLHRWLPSWRFVLGAILAVAFLGAGALVAAYASTEIPNPADDTKAQTTTVYYANNPDGSPGPVMGTFAAQKRTLVEYETLPEYVGQSVAAAEDKTFFTNNSGVSITGMGRALLNNLRGGPTQGGSTLTQQYVERYYVDETTTDYVGKFKETILAIKIAKVESKTEIMQRYLNTIYFGRDSYGIQAAARAYFDVDAKDLTREQAALLAGIIPSPNNWDPAKAPEKAEARWNIVLDSMEEEGWLTAAERAPMVFPPTVEYKRDNTMAGPKGHLLEMVRDELKREPLALTDDQINRRGLSVVTTIQQPLQAAAEGQVGAFRAGTLPGQDGATPHERTRVSLSSVDPKDGAIVALYGGPDFLADQRNTATFDLIQPGSTFKPFTLIAALEQGIALKTRYSGRTPQEFGDWKVNNFGNDGFGNIDLVEATAQSVNTVYAQLNLEIGPEKTAQVAERAGLTAPVDTNRANVLGTETLNPMDMAGAYATIASGGVRVDPYIVRTVTNPDGSVAYQHKDPTEQAFAADVIADATYAMTQVVQKGSGKQWIKPLDRPVAGKTGTTNDNKAAWFVGFTPNIVTEVSLSQIGEDGKSQESIGQIGKVKFVTGSTWPAFLWQSYMKDVFAQPQYAEVLEFPERANVGGKPSPTATQAPSETVAPTVEPTQEAPTEVTVPAGLEGKLEADATATIVNAGLTASVVSEPSDTVTAGRVIRVDPKGGAALAPGSSVTVVVSTGPKPKPVPTAPPVPVPTETAPVEP
ncbi:transglycosylase domain-containing protein [Cellulomonas fengjieae]|uniref:Penicillin-binding protein n=1 Tax=Cellulomonas fengjieae TaxID=2819978 RepID=A0ABS3SI28_9CELL|nr:transglycosylase domain-containing protein [Cellulomonas fengjieae]MBO3085408.1 penicillin-binding protein [Cellulomonas fengjieae]MBO3101153.1 penicillin-binding protein [Cellulomonas fengjieae]QVI66041.1 penicillin-binding protein [Cellulomonas fengjieae]